MRERRHRAREDIVRKGLATFIEVGNALKWIRDHKTYRMVDGFETFEAYVQARWDMARRTAYQQITAAVVVENVRHGAQIAPTNERQVRPLVSLEPDQQRAAWTCAVEKADGKTPTGRQVQQVVKKIKKEAEAGEGEQQAAPEEAPQAQVEKQEKASAKVQQASKKTVKAITSIEEAFEGDILLADKETKRLLESLGILHDRVGGLMEKLAQNAEARGEADGAEDEEGKEEDEEGKDMGGGDEEEGDGTGEKSLQTTPASRIRRRRPSPLIQTTTASRMTRGRRPSPLEPLQDRAEAEDEEEEDEVDGEESVKPTTASRSKRTGLKPNPASRTKRRGWRPSILEHLQDRAEAGDEEEESEGDDE